MKSVARFGDLMRALQAPRETLRIQLGIRGGGAAAGWRTWSRSEVAVLAVQRALMTAGLNVEAARSITDAVAPENAFLDADWPASWIAIAVKPDRWDWGMVKRVDTLAIGSPWPVVLVHPRTVVEAALTRLDGSDETLPLPVFRPPNVRPAIPSLALSEGGAP